MSDFPTVVDYSNPVINCYSTNSIATGLNSTVSTFSSTGAWPSSNLAIFIPFRVATPYVAAQMFWWNGATVGTNGVDVGVYDSQGNRLVSSGSTTTSGASGIQIVDVTDTLLQQGLYYMAMAMNGTTDVIQRSAATANNCAAMGVLSQVTAFALPSTATMIRTTTAYIPLLGISSSTVV